jgi:hypothetical protein
MSLNQPLRLCSTLVLGGAALLTPNAGDAWPVLVFEGGRDCGKDVAVANDGSIFEAGMVGPAAGLKGAGPVPQRKPAGPAGPLNAFVLRVGADDPVLWMRSFGGPAVEMSHAPTVSPGAEAVVRGFFAGSGPYAPEVRMVGSAGGRDGFVAFFSATGEIRSGFTVGGEGDDEIFHLALTASGDVVIAGSLRATPGDRRGCASQCGRQGWLRRQGRRRGPAALGEGVRRCRRGQRPDRHRGPLEHRHRPRPQARWQRGGHRAAHWTVADRRHRGGCRAALGVRRQAGCRRADGRWSSCRRVHSTSVTATLGHRAACMTAVIPRFLTGWAQHPWRSLPDQERCGQSAPPGRCLRAWRAPRPGTTRRVRYPRPFRPALAASG